MKVFISWSGNLSKELGEVFRNWLPSVLQVVRPYFTPSDIEKGARWSTHIASELEEAKIGIFCLTRENLNSPWIMFEAGAISKVVGEAHVCPILFALEPSDITGPLSQFQLTPFIKEDMHKLVCTINEECGNQKLLDNTRDSVFEMWWPKLESGVSGVLSRHTEHTDAEIRSDREVLEEILSLSRLLARENRVVQEAERHILNLLNVTGRKETPKVYLWPKCVNNLSEEESLETKVNSLRKLIKKELAESLEADAGEPGTSKESKS